jgi:hypothetical protein
MLREQPARILGTLAQQHQACPAPTALCGESGAGQAHCKSLTKPPAMKQERKEFAFPK